MQQNTSSVQEFKNKEGLSISIDKTKVMVFSKNERLCKECFNFAIGQSNLEIFSEYKYLGVNITSNSKFLKAEKKLSLKASIGHCFHSNRVHLILI